MTYRETDLVRIAKRENNTKRGYLVVNPLQGKHIPVSPEKALELFVQLAHQLDAKYENEKLLFVGFAETATAIGAQVAVTCRAPYIQTTREAIPGVEYLFFSEEHSHATEQKLVKNDIDSVIGRTDRIIFVEDEVTTGKTILNIIDILQSRYGGNVKFAVASLLNGMTQEHLDRYREKGIPLHYLVKTDHAEYDAAADSFKGNGIYHTLEDMGSFKGDGAYYKPEDTGSFKRDGAYYKPEDTGAPEPTGDSSIKEAITNNATRPATETDSYRKTTTDNATHPSMETGAMEEHNPEPENSPIPETIPIGKAKPQMRLIPLDGYINARRVTDSTEYAKACSRLADAILEKINLSGLKNVLVIGTEEFMYPALVAGMAIEKTGIRVRCHSTTRSPIAVSSEPDYPLHSRYELRSLYDSERKTFIYDLDSYDLVLILTDAAPPWKAEPSPSQDDHICRTDADTSQDMNWADAWTGLNSLVHAVNKYNDDIVVFCWR